MESFTTDRAGTAKGFNDYTKDIGEYLETYYKLSVIKATDKATGIASSTLTVAGIFIFGFFIVLFASLALAIWLGHAVESNVGGYLLVAGFYLLLLAVVISLRKRIVFPFIRNLIIRKIYE